ncbi:MAG TPA: hypothetical protein VGQ00_01235 [Candidatus Norongarragalinales archaeon]|jgi:hypothetical protein|nr:hypothetical protein [Candidatus Norongarragalinales archaeon]
MSKLERFFLVGHPKLVLRHLKRVKKFETLNAALDHQDSRVRQVAAKKLANLGTDQAVSRIDRFINEEIARSSTFPSYLENLHEKAKGRAARRFFADLLQQKLRRLLDRVRAGKKA